MHALKSAVSRSVTITDTDFIDHTGSDIEHASTICPGTVLIITVDTDKVAARERHAVRVAEVVARLRSGAGR